MLVGGANMTGMLCQGRVGHTHGREDQTNSTMAKGLRRSEVLQDPGDFATRIRETLGPCTRRRLAVEKLNGALRWMDLFARLPPHFRFRGLSQTKAASERGEEACRVFKSVRRDSLDPKIEIHNPFSGAEDSPRDVVC